MLTCVEINKRIKSGATVFARVPGFDGEQRIFRARIGIFDALQVQFRIDGELRWRNANYSSIRVEETSCAKS
ncbi:MAG: hypothetical protein DMF68_01575 [Acidobacteria bacterium]|nr:MAG: hypothetical protein DMF68_01575 [Acidobacteriota bacterium]